MLERPSIERAGIVAIDPGLDCLAVARFLPPDVPTRGTRPYWYSALADEKARTFVEAVSVNTSAAAPLLDRIHTLDRWLTEYLTHARPARVFIEVPSYAGAYARHAAGGARSAAATAEGQNKLYIALGAILAAAARSGGIVRTVEAQSAKKTERLQMVELVLAAAKKPRPRNIDQRDAVGIGLGATWDL